MKDLIKNYIFDIDGTIAVNGEKVERSIIEQIIKLSEDHRIIFASARSIRDMLPMIDDSLHNKAIFIGCNGGMAFYQGEFIFSHLLPSQDVALILDFLKKNGIPYLLDGKWGYALSSLPHSFHQYVKSLSSEQVDEEELIESGISKILILSNQYKSDLLTLIAGRDLSVHTHKQEDIFDITPTGNNKYHIIKNILNEELYIAFGNDQNDFLMLDHAVISVFVGKKNDYANADFYINQNEMKEFLEIEFERGFL